MCLTVHLTCCLRNKILLAIAVYLKWLSMLSTTLNPGNELSTFNTCLLASYHANSMCITNNTLTV